MFTLGCNFCCGYCFQERSELVMSPATEQRVLRYISQNAPKKERISIDWYGGEPLLRFGQLIRMNDAAAKVCADNGTDYNISVTTNGWLLSEKVIAYLAQFNVSHLQITLDGPPETHNQSRPLASGGPTFNRILNNVTAAVDAGLTVNLRVNVWAPNISQVGKLYDILEAQGLKNRLLVLIKPVLSSPANPCEAKCLSTEDASHKIIAIYMEAAKKGWVAIPFASHLQGHEFCIVDSVGQLIIDPAGYLYKCGERFLPEEQVGKLSPGGEAELIEEKRVPWIAKDPLGFPECRDCKVLPICMGGCSMKRFWRPDEPPCVDSRYCLPDLLRAIVASEANVTASRTTP